MGAGASRIAYLANDENVPIEMLIMYVARAARLEYFWAVLLLIDFATTMIKYNQAEDWCDEQEDKEDDDKTYQDSDVDCDKLLAYYQTVYCMSMVLVALFVLQALVLQHVAASYRTAGACWWHAATVLGLIKVPVALALIWVALGFNWFFTMIYFSKVTPIPNP